MKILVTGAKGFVGRNLCAQLNNIRLGLARNYPGVNISEVMEYDIDSEPGDLDDFCARANFVFNLAGVNRPENPAEFMAGNFGFASTLLDTLRKHNNTCPVMLSSSIQASLEGRYANSEYGKSKLAGERLFERYATETGAKVLIYRFPNLFGKWCRPNYNSVVATFCHNTAHDLPIQVNDPATSLTLAYIDDVVNHLISQLTATGCAPSVQHLSVPVTHDVTLAQIVDMLHEFKEMPLTAVMPEIEPQSFKKKLYSTYLSYLPAEKAIFPLKMNVDNRGSFTELIKTAKCGQMSVNISLPGITKGQHWHNSKWELFIVVSGQALIRQRRVDSTDVIEFRVSGHSIQAVHMLPGYTHSIINLSDTEPLVTLMWANEQFDPANPDTFYNEV